MAAKTQSPEELIAEELIARYSNQTLSIAQGMISLSKLPRLPKRRRPPIDPSSHPLDDLPTELQHGILGQLDFVSLFRFRRASFRSQEMVESLPAFRSIMDHALGALFALGQTSIKNHTAQKLFDALMSKQCIACEEFGAFLFLPTLERCCYECLRRNQSLWVLPVDEAATYFGLGESEVRQLPSMFSTPGQYSNRRSWHKGGTEIVSVKTAKQRALEKYGSKQGSTQYYVGIITDMQQGKTLSITLYSTISRRLTWFNNAPMTRSTEDPIRKRTTCDEQNDKYAGMASVHFPSLNSNDVAETGLLCVGCRYQWELCQYGRLNEIANLKSLIHEGADAARFIEGLANRARSKTDFLEHIRECRAAHALFKGDLTSTEVME